MKGMPRRFDDLAALAASEKPPPIDVSGEVVRSIASRPPTLVRGDIAGERVWWCGAAAALVVAVSVLWVASQQGVLFEDPLIPWFQSLALVMS